MHVSSVLDSGHMVPLDQPAVSLDMITRFLSGADFSAGPARVTPPASGRPRPADCTVDGTGASVASGNDAAAPAEAKRHRHRNPNNKLHQQ